MAKGEPVHVAKLLHATINGEKTTLLALMGNNSTALFDAHPLVDFLNAQFENPKAAIVVVSHSVADAFCTGLSTSDILLPLSPTNSLIAYERPGTRLGPFISGPFINESRIHVPTGIYEGESKIALVSTGFNPEYLLKDGQDFIYGIPDVQLIPVTGFPDRNGSYLLHKPTGIPQGEPVGDKQFSKSRALSRSPDAFVTFPVRFGASFCGKMINLNYPLSRMTGLVVQVPQIDVERVSAFFASVAALQNGGHPALRVSADDLHDLIRKYLDERIPGEPIPPHLAAAARQLL